MKYLQQYLLIIESTKPKISDMECLVPHCPKEWELSGSRQGFVKSAGMRHCGTHWHNYHHENNHNGDHAGSCSECIKASINEYERRYRKKGD